MTWLSADERAVLSLVLEPRLDVTHKGNPAIKPLSLYSSELKGLKQIASALDKVTSGTFSAQEDRTRARYFRTLSIHGLVTGTPAAPVLTPESGIVLSLAAKDDKTSDYWQRNRDAVEGPLVLAIANKLAGGQEDAVHEYAKRIFWNAQFLFDLVADHEIAAALPDLELLRLLQLTNSVGIEAARYFRLTPQERSFFQAAFRKVLTTGATAVVSNAEIERRAEQYYHASTGFQADVRFRVAGFLTAYRNAQIRMGAQFPRLSRALDVTNSPDKSTSKRARIVTPTNGAIGPHQLIISGCPGSGKSHWIEDRLSASPVTIFRTQFHAETSYYDFVGNYKPVPVFESLSPGVTITTVDGKSLAQGRPLINYQFVPGPLIEALVVALSAPTTQVVLIIEELNRGNCAAVFGDIFQLLDRDGSGGSRYGISPSMDLQGYLLEAGVLTPGTKLHLPPNFYIWATMNSADQGVFPLDTAFRRRWDFIYRGHTEPCAYPNEIRRIKFGGYAYDWEDFRGALNMRLRNLGAHEDKLIGPYFLTVEQLASPDAVLNKLLLYIWDDVLRFRQDELFTESSFADVAKRWDGANGSPLSLEIDPDKRVVDGDNAIKASQDGAADVASESQTEEVSAASSNEEAGVVK